MISFCNQKSEEAKKIIKLINTDIIAINGHRKDSIKDIYETWGNNFDEDQGRPPIFKRETINNKFSLNGRSDISCLGIDFPTWFNFSEEKTKIMVVGIDPLRRKSDWKQFDKKEHNESDSVIIGTPYALHIKKLRDGRTKNYWNFIEKLLIEKNHSVYLTDIFKVFYYYDSKGKKKRSYNDKEFTTGDIGDFHEKILREEINIVRPDLIIAFGNQAKNFIGIQAGPITKVKIKPQEYKESGIPAICMVHLSGATRKVSKESFIKTNLENSEKYEFIEDGYIQIVENVLNEI